MPGIQGSIFCQLLTTDGEPITTGTTTVYLATANAVYAAGGGTCTHLGNGLWMYAATAGEIAAGLNTFVFQFVNSAGFNRTEMYGDFTGLLNQSITAISDVNSLVSPLETKQDSVIEKLDSDQFGLQKIIETIGGIPTIDNQAIANAVDSQITQTHGSGSYVSESLAGVSTSLSGLTTTLNLVDSNISELTTTVDGLEVNPTIIVTPLSSAVANDSYFTNGVEDLQISCAQGEDRTFNFVIENEDGPIDFTGKTLKFLVRNQNYDGLFSLTGSPNITISGSTITVQLSSTQTNHRDYSGRWELWNTTDNRLIGQGPIRFNGQLKQL